MPFFRLNVMTHARRQALLRVTIGNANLPTVLSNSGGLARNIRRQGVPNPSVSSPMDGLDASPPNGPTRHVRRQLG